MTGVRLEVYYPFSLVGNDIKVAQALENQVLKSMQSMGHSGLTFAGSGLDLKANNRDFAIEDSTEEIRLMVKEVLSMFQIQRYTMIERVNNFRQGDDNVKLDFRAGRGSFIEQPISYQKEAASQKRRAN